MPAAAAPPARTAATDARGRARAWGWVAHLEAGGTTPWAQWRERGTDGGATARWLPGAQQLELLRRLNRDAAGQRALDPVLVRRVLVAAATGRGRHDVGLVGAEPSGRFGPDPVDPADLTDDDLLRVAVGLLAADLGDAAAASPGIPSVGSRTTRRPRRTRLVRARYRLVGDPELAGPRRAALVADGRPPGGRGAAVLVLGADLATMLGHAWTAGAFAEGGPSWTDFLATWSQRDGVPRRIDLPSIAHRWWATPQVGRLDVVLDLDEVPRLLHLRAAPAGPPLSTPAPLSTAAVDLTRRVATALGLLVPGDDRAERLAGRLRPRLEQLQGHESGPPPLVPPEHRAWVDARAARMRDRLVRAGHPFVGDPDALLPRWAEHDAAAPSGSAPAAEPLDLAVRLLGARR